MSFERPDFIEEIRREVQATTNKQKEQSAYRLMMLQTPGNELFDAKDADKWLTEEYSKPDAKQLLGTLWHEQELCILFADTNLGKSILAVQIGYYLAKQGGMDPFGSQMEETLKVLYIDFELSAAQFKSRYTDRTYGQLHFSENFVRAQFNPNGDNPLLYDKYEDYVQRRIGEIITKTKPKVLIIDNITYMGSASNHAGGAMPLMKALKALKIKHKLSMLVLAHTPKRSLFSPITVNDLQGSKMLINFADSAFALGQSSQDPGLRYLKQIKQRNTGQDFGAEHICLFRIVKKQTFLCLEFEGMIPSTRTCKNPAPP